MCSKKRSSIAATRQFICVTEQGAEGFLGIWAALEQGYSDGELVTHQPFTEVLAHHSHSEQDSAHYSPGTSGGPGYAFFPQRYLCHLIN